MHRTIFDTPIVNTVLRAFSTAFMKLKGWKVEGSLAIWRQTWLQSKRFMHPSRANTRIALLRDSPLIDFQVTIFYIAINSTPENQGNERALLPSRLGDFLLL